MASSHKPARLNVNAIMARMRRNVQQAVQFSAIAVRKQVTQLLQQTKTPRGGRSQSAPGSPPGNKTGALTRSIDIDLSEITKLRAKVFTTLVYARIQEFGGTITAKSGGYLAIPLEGVTGKPRDFTNTYFVRNGDKLILMQNYGKRGKSKPIFAMVKSVTLPARPYMRPGLEMQREAIRDRIRRAVASSTRSR